MEKITVKIKTLTPIWTGDSTAHPNGLRISGVIGGMRTIFESIVRCLGGHTCDITSNQSCNYEKDKNICPVCKIFGCTGYSRIFKINISLPIIKNLQFPLEDSLIHNRPHYTNNDYVTKKWHRELINKTINKTKIKTINDADAYIKKYFRNNNEIWEYKKPTSVTNWIASMFGGNYNNIEKNIKIISGLKVSYQKEPSDIKFTLLRDIGFDINAIFNYLLSIMSECHGLGAKVNQGWGFFDIINPNKELIEIGYQEISKMIKKSNFNKNVNNYFLNANQFSYYEYKLSKYRQIQNNNNFTDTLGFSWDSKCDDKDFIPLGFALQYRLRRDIKFSQIDLPSSYGKNYKDVYWKASGEFANELFGNAMRGSKKSGYIGVSHLYKRDDIWYVKLLLKIPENIKQSIKIHIPNVNEFVNNRFNNLLNGAL